MTHTYDLIREAILEKKQVVAYYHGKLREMCPHVIGYKNGREKALFYQFGGRSKRAGGITAASAEWRVMFIDELSDVSIRSGSWQTSKDYSGPGNNFDLVDVVID